MKAKFCNGALVECITHKRKRTYKTRNAAPKNKCLACWACWLADRIETSIYQADLDDLVRLIKNVKLGKMEVVNEDTEES